MSGNTIGGIAGGLIGFAIGGPAGAQWGWMIGSVVGGIVDPQTIQGAQWQNQQLQGSADGLGRAVIFGTATVTGNLLDAEPGGPRIGKKSEGGKGGPEVERDTAILTYAIEICDSSELRGTKVNGVIAVWEDEKLVYDARPNGSGVVPGDRAASSAKWAKNKTFYFGGEDQMPPPELEAIHGSGNVPAYRGSCIMVVHDEDLMVDLDDKPRGRIPTYRFLVSVCAVKLQEATLFVSGSPTGIGVSPFAMAPAVASPEFFTLDGVPGADLEGAIPAAYGGRVLVVKNGDARVTSSPLTGWTTIAHSGSSVSMACGGPAGWLVVQSSGLVTALKMALGGSSFTNYTFTAQRGAEVATGATFDTWCRFTGGQYWGDYVYSVSSLLKSDALADPVEFASLPTDHGTADVRVTDVVVSGGYLYGRVNFGTSSARGICRTAYDGTIPSEGLDWSEEVLAPQSDVGRVPGWLSSKGGIVIALCVGGEYAWTSVDGFAEPHPTGLSGSAIRPIAVAGDRFYLIDGTHCVSTVDGITFTAPVPHMVADAKGIVAIGRPEYDLSIPDLDGYTIDPETGDISGPSEIGGVCTANLETVIRTIHRLGAPQLQDADFDLGALEGDIVRGYAIQDAAVTVAEACDPLRRVWTFDLPSYDGKIHAIKRGRDVDWTLPEDDLIAMDSDYEQSMQDDTVSLPRKLHLAYNDPSIDYKETTQISERYSTDVRVVGEEKISMGQLVMTATEAKQAVVKQHKLAWLNAEDTRTLSAPLEYIGAVNSDIVQFRGRRYRVDQMRVEGLQVTFESAAYDRASSYQSTAVGTEGVPPPPMGAALRGPTVSVFMNLPVLRDADDKAGIYWAASGMLEGWRGALLQMSRDGTTFENLNIAVPAPCTIGTLQAGILSASRYGLDEVNQIMVKLNPLSPGLDSTDMDGLLREANSAAILYADGTAEIVQFLTATETAPREYTLSGLLRGRLDTTPGAHNAGASFVLLNDAIRFVPLRNDDVGATITFRAMSAGTVAENNDSVALTLGNFKSLAEWEPAMVRATTGVNEVSVTWAGRGRLGSSRMPVHSLNFDKYRVRVTKSGTTATVETGNQYATVTYTGISEPYTTGATALSRIDAQFNSPEGTA